ncbi:MAG: hypothetical protein LPK03_08020, partial [Pontibacter sp.]|nr:hypothetical protein [Pontibacter sp.]
MIRLLHIFLCILLAVEVCAREQQEPYSKARLEQAITQYEKLAQTTDWHTFPNNLLIRPGDSSLHVPLLQQNLLLLG